MEEENSVLIRSAQVIEMLGISQSLLKNYRQKGILRTVQYVPKGDHRYYLADVQKLLEKK